MKITNTSDVLIVDSRPWLLGFVLGMMVAGLLGGTVFAIYKGYYLAALVPLPIAAFMAVFAWAVVRRDQLVLNARDQTATYRHRNLFYYTSVTYDLAHLSHAELEEKPGNDGGTVHRMRYHITAGMDEGAHPFTLAYTNGSGSQHAVRAVNRWLKARRG